MERQRRLRKSSRTARCYSSALHDQVSRPTGRCEGGLEAEEVGERRSAAPGAVRGWRPRLRAPAPYVRSSVGQRSPYPSARGPSSLPGRDQSVTTTPRALGVPGSSRPNSAEIAALVVAVAVHCRQR